MLQKRFKHTASTNFLILISRFTKTWRVQNNGEEDWPAGCELQITDGNPFESPPR